jgi:hypothetical protein
LEDAVLTAMANFLLDEPRLMEFINGVLISDQPQPHE